MKSSKWIVITLAVTLLVSSCKSPLVGGGVEVGNGAQPTAPSDTVAVQSPDRTFSMSYSNQLTFNGSADNAFTLDNSKVVKPGEPVSTLKFQVESIDGSLNSVDDLRNNVIKKNHDAIADRFQNTSNLVNGTVGLYFESVSNDSGYSETLLAETPYSGSYSSSTGSSSSTLTASPKRKIGHYYFINKNKEVLHFTANAYESGNGFQLIFPVVYQMKVASPVDFPLVNVSTAKVTEPLGIKSFSVTREVFRDNTPLSIQVVLTGEGAGVVGGKVSAHITGVVNKELVTHQFSGPITSEFKDGKHVGIRVNYPKELVAGKYFLSMIEITDKAENFIKVEAKRIHDDRTAERPSEGFRFFVSSTANSTPKPFEHSFPTFQIESLRYVVPIAPRVIKPTP